MNLEQLKALLEVNEPTEDMITKIYNRVAGAAKYKKFDHVLNITYECI